MAEHLIDVLDKRGTVVRTYPVTVADHGTSEDGRMRAKALEAAAKEGLVGALSSRLHVSRGGQLAPYGEDAPVKPDTMGGAKQSIRERAYALWEEGGQERSPEEYWNRARREYLQERAYALWQQEGSPEGRSNEYWQRVCALDE